MACIYCITNKINGKQYVGKSITDAECRFKEHISDSKKDRCKHRPLYRAFNKYGIENFKLEVLEQVSNTKQLADREKYWILKKNTFRFGYNATIGGDGSILYDHTKIIELFDKGCRLNDISKLMHCHTDTIRNAIRANSRVSPEGHPHRIDMFSKDGKFISFFLGSTKVAKFLMSHGFENIKEDTITVNISKCCRGFKRPDYGYIWKYHNFMNNITDVNYKEIDKKSGYYIIKNTITGAQWYGQANNLKKKIIAIIDAVNKGKTHTPLYKEMSQYSLEAFEVDFPDEMPENATIIEEINNPPKEKPQQEGLRSYPYQYRINRNTVLMAYTEEDLNKLKKSWNVI